jgi:LytS/YehU family sensor histidine kinase
MHLLTGTALGLVHGMLNGALYWTVMAPYRRGDAPITAAMIGITTQFLFLNLVTYAAVVGAAHALAFAARLREREVAGARLEQAVTAARLDALRMELNPHFLFNTLNAISGLVLNGERDTAVRMLARLGDLLRTTLDHANDQQIVLARELEFLEIYLEIVRTRFCDRLTVDLAIERDARTALVPTLILQPLVENAVRHGVAQRTGPGRITVGARRTDGRLELSVTDRAEGDAVVEGAGHGRPGNGIGLANTRRRLEQLYGGAGSVRLEPLGDGRGSQVTVSLPYASGQPG